MFKIGELIRWRKPLDEDYSYGRIIDMSHKLALVVEYGYYYGNIIEVHLSYAEKVERR